MPAKKQVTVRRWMIEAACAVAVVALFIVYYYHTVTKAQDREINDLYTDVSSMKRRLSNEPDPDKAIQFFLSGHPESFYLVSQPNGTYDMRFTLQAVNMPFTDVEDFISQRDQCREELLREKCGGEMPDRTPLYEDRKLVEERENYCLYAVTVTTRIGKEKRMALAIPRNVKNPREALPGIVAFRGTGGDGHGEMKMFDREEYAVYNKDIFHENYTYPCLFADRAPDKQQYVVLAVDTVYDPEKEKIPEEELARQEFFEGVAALDLLESLPEVDPNRIGCVGLSAGATMCQTLAAVDDRVKAIIAYGTNLGRPFPDSLGISMLVAPKPAIYANGIYDFEFLPFTAAHRLEAARQTYRLFGKPENLVYIVHPGEHLFEGQYALGLFDEFIARMNVDRALTETVGSGRN